MANKKISQLFENPYPKTGDIFPIVQDGVTYKLTLDNLFRLYNNQYNLIHNLDPYIIDDLNNYYGRGRFISGNLMISGSGNNARLPHSGSCVLRVYDGNFILNGSGIVSGLNSGVTDLGHSNSTQGLYAINIGQFNITTGRNNEIFGSRNNASGVQLEIFGDFNSISGFDSKVFGTGNQSLGTELRIYGQNNLINGTDLTIIGEDNQATGVDSIIYGHNNIIRNVNQIKVFGNNNTGELFSSGSFIVGKHNYVGNSSEAGTNSLVYGDLNHVSGKNSLVFGRNNLIKIKSGALEKISVYGLQNDVSGIEVDVYGRLNLNSGLTNQIYGHSNTGFGDINFTLGAYNRIERLGVENYLLGDYIILSSGSGNYIASRNTTVNGNNNHIVGQHLNLSGTGNWVAGNNSKVTGIDVIAIGKDLNLQLYSNFSNVFGRSNVIAGSGYYSDIYGSDNTNSGQKVIIVGKNNTIARPGLEATIIGRINDSVAEKSFIVGERNVSSGFRSYTFGQNNDNNAVSGYIIGEDNFSTGNNCFTVGKNNINSGIRTHIDGRNNQIENGVYDSRVFGNQNRLRNAQVGGTLNAGIIGNNNILKSSNNALGGNDSYSFIYGNNSTVYGYECYSYGNNNIIQTGSSYTDIFGSYNNTDMDGDNNFPSYGTVIFGKGNTFLTGIDNGIYGLINSIQNSNYAFVYGKGNLVSSGLNNVVVLGKEITIPKSGNAGYKLNRNNMDGAVQIGANNSAKITILENGNIGFGTSGTLPFENPQELIHVRSGNVLFDATEGGYFKFYDKNRYDNQMDNPSQVNQPGDIRAIISGGNFKIDGDLVLSTGYGETGQFLHGRIFQEASVRNLDGSMWCYAVSDIHGNCGNTNNPYNNGTEIITGTDGTVYTHKTGLWQPYGFDLGWDTPITTYASGYVSGFIQNISTRIGAISQPDFCNGDCNFDYQPHEAGRIGGRAITFLDGNPTSAIITGRYTLVHTPIMKTTNLYLPPVAQNSGVVYTVKNLGKGNIMVFTTGSERIDLFFTGFLIDQRFASYEFLSNGSGWFLV